MKDSSQVVQKRIKIPLPKEDLINLFCKKAGVNRSRTIDELVLSKGYLRTKRTLKYMKTYLPSIPVTPINIKTVYRADKHLRSNIKLWIEEMEVTYNDRFFNLLINIAHNSGDYSNIFIEEIFANNASCIKAKGIVASEIEKARLNIETSEPWDYIGKISIGPLRNLFSLLRSDIKIMVLEEFYSKKLSVKEVKKFEQHFQFMNDLRNAVNHAEQLFLKKRLRFPSKDPGIGVHEAILKTMKYMIPKSKQEKISKFVKQELKRKNKILIIENMSTINILGEKC